MSAGCDDGGDGDGDGDGDGVGDGDGDGVGDGGGLKEETHGCREEKQVLVLYFIFP